ncbi:unnamed protein product [Clonostachys rosea f. rosea IK726]|nr:unnamed protein product [Clonostachys rosea f. rosea IK726]
MDRFGMDRESLILAIQLQCQDLTLLEQSRKGKQRLGETTDSDLALEACRHELESMAMLVSDRALSLSMARAVNSDARAIAKARASEEQAARDREFAVRLSRDPHTEPTPAEAKNEEEEWPADGVDDAWIEAFKSMDLFMPIAAEDDVDEEHVGHAGPSRWISSRGQTSAGECIACGDRFSSLALSHSPCSHEYCRQCLISLVHSSLQDESLFPPRCCGQHIPIKPGPWFSPKLIGEFQAKKIEFDTPNRTYCNEPSCSTFVPPMFIIGEAAWCPKCSRKTCIHCKGRYHTGICPSDGASQQVLQLAEASGWQRCYACQRIIELDHGCNHITCLCKAEFCYVCGERWKTCTCPQWQEERLIRRANAIVDRANGAGRIDERVRQIRVERERRNLVENHECTHELWKSRSGPHRCEECHDVLREFIYECRQCHIMACRRCRFNRL